MHRKGFAYFWENLPNKRTQIYGESCMVFSSLAANRFLFQNNNGYIQIIGFQTY